MSHAPERAEKNCLNCGTTLVGRYCHACGQENVEPRQSFWHLVRHFVFDIFHFDGKFFTTVGDLLVRPGFLSKEFIAGRRVKYLDPVRMYIFTSAFFFLVFLTFFGPHRQHVMTVYEPGVGVHRTGELHFDDDSTYQSFGAYDSAQQALPKEKRDGFLNRMIERRVIGLNKTYHGDGHQMSEAFIETFFHNFPKIFFLSLPLFAALLKLLYLRRKGLLYSDHAIFTLHLYVFGFLGQLVLLLLGAASEASGWRWLGLLSDAVWLYGAWYLYRSLRVFYGQSRGRTVGKAILLVLLGGFLLVLLLAVFSLFTAFQF